MLDHSPRFNASAAEQIVRNLYGLDAKATALTSERDQNFLVESGNGDHIELKIANALEEPSMLDAQQRAMMHLAPAALGQADVAANPACAGMWSQAGAGGRDLYQPTFRGVLSMRFA